MTQAQLFKQVWDERPHRSEVSGFTIREPRAANFAHILPKSTYPRFKYNPDNICLMLETEHYDWDNSRWLCQGPRWDRIREREAELKKKYRNA